MQAGEEIICHITGMVNDSYCHVIPLFRKHCYRNAGMLSKITAPLYTAVVLFSVKKQNRGEVEKGCGGIFVISFVERVQWRQEHKE